MLSIVLNEICAYSPATLWSLISALSGFRAEHSVLPSQQFFSPLS